MKTLNSVASGAVLALESSKEEQWGGWMEKMYLEHSGDTQAVSIAIIVCQH